ncbi:hypothetical protein ACFXMT_33725 [Streptomyces mirabilis]|uniref:hypothetical protein n=1 Tax=Streptomyces mirabilis TaxID=68239 RepID=UPI0036C95B31
MQTPDAFRVAHGDVIIWSSADIESYEHTLEAASPAYAEVIASGRFVLGRNVAGGEVVVELATAEDLAQHIQADPLQPLLIGGTTRRDKTSYAAVLQQMQQTAG